MTLSVVADRPALPAEWDAAWASSPSATYFQSRSWSLAWERGTGGRISTAGRLLTLSNGESVVVPMSLERRAAGLLQVARLSAGDTYGGWLVPSQSSDVSACVLDWLRRTYSSLTLIGNPHANDAEIARLATRMTTTRVLDLRVDRQRLLAARTSRNSRSERRAERAGVVIERVANGKPWSDYFALYLETRERWGAQARTFHSRALLEAIGASGSGAELWLARKGDEALAGAICLADRRGLSYWHGASSVAGRGLGASHLLFATVIRDAHARGLERFDFLGSGDLAGVDQFKMSFGAVPLNVAVLVVASRMVQIARRLQGAWSWRR